MKAKDRFRVIRFKLINEPFKKVIVKDVSIDDEFIIYYSFEYYQYVKVSKLVFQYLKLDNKTLIQYEGYGIFN